MANKFSRREFLNKKLSLAFLLFSGCSPDSDSFTKKDSYSPTQQAEKNKEKNSREHLNHSIYYENSTYYDNYFSRKELKIIWETAERVGVDPVLLMAIRRAENGGKGREFGIMPTQAYKKDRGYKDKEGNFRVYRNEFEKQATWAAWTIKRNRERYQKNPRVQVVEDFIEFLAKRYAPIGASNDPKGLNKNWEKNVRYYYEKYSKSGVCF